MKCTTRSTRIWKKSISVEELDAIHLGTAVAQLGMEFLEVGDDFIRARVPVHMGRTTHVWQIELSNDAGELTCVSRITMAILAPK